MEQTAAGMMSKVRHTLRLDKLPNGTRRIVVMIAGSVVLIAGVAMMVLPGPAFIMIPLGFAILATEFQWAERCCNKVIQTYQRFQKKWRERKKKR